MQLAEPRKKYQLGDSPITNQKIRGKLKLECGKSSACSQTSLNISSTIESRDNKQFRPTFSSKDGLSETIVSPFIDFPVVSTYHSALSHNHDLAIVSPSLRTSSNTPISRITSITHAGAHPDLSTLLPLPPNARHCSHGRHDVLPLPELHPRILRSPLLPVPLLAVQSRGGRSAVSRHTRRHLGVHTVLDADHYPAGSFSGGPLGNPHAIRFGGAASDVPARPGHRGEAVGEEP